MLGWTPFHKRHSDEAIPLARGDPWGEVGCQHGCLEYGRYGEWTLVICLLCLNQTNQYLQTFELITGDYLFDPQSGTKYGKDDDHIAQIIELLGTFPKSLCISGKWSQEIFNRKGELRNIHRLRHWALPDVLREKYHFNVEDARRIADFLLPMLELMPAERANAGGMASHAFMDGTRGMEGKAKLDVEVGSKGEGIEGWATEVKKVR